MDNPIRWKQRFVHFERAYTQFVTIIDIGEPDELTDIEKMALIQAFEFTFELAWKTMKDYLEEEGYMVGSPRAVLRQAFQSEHIKEGEVWLKALRMRNQTVHTYNEIVWTKQSILSTLNFPLKSVIGIMRLSLRSINEVWADNSAIRRNYHHHCPIFRDW